MAVRLRSVLQRLSYRVPVFRHHVVDHRLQSRRLRQRSQSRLETMRQLRLQLSKMSAVLHRNADDHRVRGGVSKHRLRRRAFNGVFTDHYWYTAGQYSPRFYLCEVRPA